MTTPRADLLADARHEVLVMSTSGPAAHAPLGAVRPSDHVHLGRGVGYRILVPDTARTAPANRTPSSPRPAKASTIRAISGTAC